jgi:L-threonylcarbamoyladenylate synthase
MKEDLINAVKCLREGGVILYPTDTVWGLGCDPGNEKAVDRIFRIKQRPENKSMLLIVDGLWRVGRFAREVPEIAEQLVEMSQKPLTLIYPGARNVAANLPAGDGSIGMRVCKDAFCNELVYRFRKPVVSTSANISGQPAPAIFGEVDKQIVKQVDYVVRHRQTDTKRARPSSIIKLHGGNRFTLVRS